MRAGPYMDSRERRVLDDIAGDGAVSLDRDADAGGAAIRLATARPAEHEVADQIALDHGKASAPVEAAQCYAERRTVDDIVGDHYPLRFEFGIQRDSLEIVAGIANHLQVRGGISAHGGECRVFDTVAAHGHVAGPQ